MASSQIEIASATSPSFGCILRDHNQRDRYRESGNGSSRLAIQNNIKEFVRDLHATSSSSSSAIPIPDQKSASNGVRKINARLENEQDCGSLVRSAGNSPGGASSLVQMWEARMNRSHSFNQNTINSASSSKTDSSLSNVECVASESKKPEMEMEAEEPETALSKSASERERVRVADIIKRLTKTSSGGEDQGSSSSSKDPSRESSPDIVNPSLSSTSFSPKKNCPVTCSSSPRVRERSSILDQQQQSPPRKSKVAFPQMSNMPRLRGRQAIQDLFTQMERDRQSEICSLVDQRAVSKFAQKGRIQSMLRLKVLQRGLMSPLDHLAPSPPPRPKGTSSSIAARRSRFDPEAESQAISKSGEDESSSRGLDPEVMADNIPSEVAKSTVSPSRRPCQENGANSHCDAAKPFSDSTTPCKEENLKCHKQDATVTACEVGSSSASMQSVLCDVSLHTEATTTTTTITLSSASERQHNVQQQRDSDVSEYMPEMGSFVTWEDPCYETNESSSCWDGNRSTMSADEYNTPHCLAESSCYNDWFSDICRPRSYWEDLRQAWYQEVRETTSEDAEIRQLLDRKTVSNFLDSSFRVRMDQLMMTRLSHQVAPAEEEYPQSQETTNQVMMRFFSHGNLGESNQQEQDGQSQDHVNNAEQVDQEEEDIEEEEDGNVVGSEYNEVSSYFEQNPVSPQLPLPSPMSSSTWSSFREPELSEESEQAGSNYPQRSSFQYTNSRTNLTPLSTTNHTSLEMELIYDLKGHMEQLYQEMTELRKSIRCCMDMQATLHQSFNQPSVGVECATKKPENGTAVNLKKGSCCICYEMPVDSLLYRCGHMCTCLKCAQELQWSSGRCPICRAPIMDVVRAYTD